MNYQEALQSAATDMLSGKGGGSKNWRVDITIFGVSVHHDRKEPGGELGMLQVASQTGGIDKMGGRRKRLQGTGGKGGSIRVSFRG